MKIRNTALIILFICSLTLVSYKVSHALFSDTATSTNNTFIASDTFPEVTTTVTPTVTPTVTSTPTPTLTPTPTIGVGDVVINELNWGGNNTNIDDEWIELRNMTEGEIDLSGWEITRLIGTETLMLTIPDEKSIPEHGYFLISKLDRTTSKIDIDPDIVDSSVILRNTDLQIKLYKGDWTTSSNLIDTADDGDGVPLAGSNAIPKKSMERKDPPGDGTVADNWQDAAAHTNMDGSGPDDEFGTPKALNGL